jgi:hypothetical protein
MLTTHTLIVPRSQKGRTVHVHALDETASPLPKPNLEGVYLVSTVTQVWISVSLPPITAVLLRNNYCGL